MSGDEEFLNIFSDGPDWPAASENIEMDSDDNPPDENVKIF